MDLNIYVDVHGTRLRGDLVVRVFRLLFLFDDVQQPFEHVRLGEQLKT